VLISIRLGTGGGRRHLLATFSRSGGPQFLARAAQWGQGGPTRPFTPDRPGHKGVTAYIHEGVIGNEIVELLGSSRVDVDNIFAVIIAHEIGPSLGLEHEYSPTGLMFAYEDAGSMERRTWLQSASAGRLGLSRGSRRKFDCRPSEGSDVGEVWGKGERAVMTLCY
jgi:hypothetical protein